MSDGDEPSSLSAAAAAHARIAHVERELRRLRVWLMVIFFAGVSAFASLWLYFATRRLEPHMDTVYARRFVVEHQGKTRAELEVDEHNWTAFKLMNEDRRGEVNAGVSPSGGAQLNVVTSGGSSIALIGSTIWTSAGSHGSAAIEANADSGCLIVNRQGAVTWYGPTGARTQVLH